MVLSGVSAMINIQSEVEKLVIQLSPATPDAFDSLVREFKKTNFDSRLAATTFLAAFQGLYLCLKGDQCLSSGCEYHTHHHSKGRTLPRFRDWDADKLAVYGVFVRELGEALEVASDSIVLNDEWAAGVRLLRLNLEKLEDAWRMTT